MVFAEDVRWCPVMVVATGPEADLAQSLSALGAAKPCAEAGPIVEDGRLQVAASGICMWDDASAVVLTSATVVAPFLRRRVASLVPSSSVDPSLVATTELFVVFPGDKPFVAEASLAACLSLPAESSFVTLQAALNSSPLEEMAWRPPVVGNLGVALLRCPGRPNHGRPMAWPMVETLQVGQRLRILCSAFGLLKASTFLGAETQCTVAAVDEASGLLLLDGRWLPGCEGGVALTEDGQPCALLAAPLRSSSGCRWTLCPAIALPGVLLRVLQSLAGDVLPRSLKAALPASYVEGQTAWSKWPPGVALVEIGSEAFGCVLLSRRHILFSAFSVPNLFARSKTTTCCLHGTQLPGTALCRLHLLQEVQSLGLFFAELDTMLSPEAVRWRFSDLDLQEGQDLIAVDLEGPKLARGVLQRWLGARYQPQAPPAFECGLPSPGLSQAHLFFETRTHSLLGIALADHKECHSCTQVLPVRCHGVSVFQLKELQCLLEDSLEVSQVNNAIKRWINRFDARWTPLKGNLEWRLEARPFAATSAL